MPTSAVTGTAVLNSDQNAFEQKAFHALRQEFYFDRCAEVFPTAQSHPGPAVVWNFLNEFGVTIAPLTELSDVTPRALGDSTVTVTLNEQGDSTTVSAKIRGVSYLQEMLRASTEMGYQAGKTQDSLARNPFLVNGFPAAQVKFGGNATSRATVDATDVLSAANVRQAAATLANASARRFGETYKAFIAPDVAYDLRTEVGADAWRDPHVHSDPMDIWYGSVGRFEGFDFIETPRLGVGELVVDNGSNQGTLPSGTTAYVNGGAGSLVDVYPTLFIAREALAKAWSTTLEGNGPMVGIEFAPVTDNLNRFKGVGFYWLGGYGIFRSASTGVVSLRYETASSIGANV
jgi:N4-gp56 family major capsid protein